MTKDETNPVSPCILCGTLTRGDVGDYCDEPHIGVVCRTYPLCCLHRRSTVLEQFIRKLAKERSMGRDPYSQIMLLDGAASVADLLNLLRTKCPPRSRRSNGQA